MVIISHRPRGAGKTTEAARIVRERNGILIVANSQLAREVMNRHGLRENQVMSVDRVRHDGLRGVDRNRPVIIDDADFVLSDLLGIRVDGCTMSVQADDGMVPGELNVISGPVRVTGPMFDREMRQQPPVPGQPPAGRPSPTSGPSDDPLENS